MNNDVKISKRMQEIVNLVDKRRVCDIGCDHGKIIAKLFIDKKIDFAIISDISEKCVLKAKNLLDSMGVVDYAMQVGDGLSVINDEDKIEQVIISGMGGLEIIKILSNSKNKFSSLILQPQRNEVDMKKYLIKNGYNIVFDKIIQDDKFYNVVKAEVCSDTNEVNKESSEINLYFGKNNYLNVSRPNPDFVNYINYLESKICKYINNLSDECYTESKKILNYIAMIKKYLGV